MIYSSTIHSPHSPAQEYLAGWQRARAELDNFRKRTVQENQNSYQQINRDLVESIVPIADNFQAMLDHIPSDLVDNNWTKGVVQVAKQLEQLLVQHNVTPINATGNKFDPHYHEAVSQTKSKQTSPGYIIEVVQPGYMIGEEVLRPAKVKVAK